MRSTRVCDARELRRRKQQIKLGRTSYYRALCRFDAVFRGMSMAGWRRMENWAAAPKGQGNSSTNESEG